MKTILTLIACCAIMYSQASTGVDTTKVEEKQSTKQTTTLLTAEEDKLFFEGGLDQKVIKPVYTTVEQAIFTAQIKQIKKDD